MDPSVLNSPKMKAQIIGNKPNTYAFTKADDTQCNSHRCKCCTYQALGESALVTEGGCLPIVVVRPSIVVAAWKEPLPGWLDNLNGPTGSVAGVGKGVMRTFYCK